MKNRETLRTAEAFLHEHIPLTVAMGLRVIADDEAGFSVAAPVALNHNHLHTAFGGSINAVATLAAYGLLWLELRDEAADVVIRESSIRFLRPIHETIGATCRRPKPGELAAFHARLGAEGKARIALHVQVRENDTLAAELRATFVAVRRAAS
ncbi:MAG TPA: YiiD C-terminal domain-containing protein [Chthoniobacteraceae bacterium]